MNKIKFKIDGKSVEVEQGKTILYAAKQVGVEIPTLCHNEKISRTTSCFVCVVKDLKTGKYLPSCSACPTEGMEVDVSSKEVQDVRKTALNLLLSEHSGDCEAPCTVACPAHASVEEYVRAGKNGDFLKSLKIIKERIPLPLSIGRVCPRFCEQDCRRNIHDKAVAINDFKRFAADMYYDEYMEELPELTGKKVAIIGGGPGGLGSAYFLRLKGIECTIFEKMPKPGGMLRYGIPEYRLPKNILDKEIKHFEKMGIEIKCNVELDKDIYLKSLKKDFDAVLIAVGSWKPSSMRCEGENLADGGISWLEQIARADWTGENPGKTIVIGGGNTAMDCLRTSVRLGSNDVSCFYRRTEKEMPAEDIEIEEAKEEGVNFCFLTAPLALRKDKNKLILTCQKMKLGEPDASGRKRPIPIPNSEYDVEADTVISAIGQKTIAPKDCKTNRWGDVDATEANMKMYENVFAAGDCVSGPATVVEAVATAFTAAEGIASFFKNQDYKAPYTINVSRGHWNSLGVDDLVYLKELKKGDRVPQRLIDIDKRTTTMQEVSATFTAEELKREGERCIECSCTAKGDCKLKEYSEDYNASPEAIKGDKFKSGYDNRHPEIIHDREKCIKCGVCIKICSEVVNESLLGLKDRGFTAKVGTAMDRVLPEFCKDCGACVEECPVGALAWKNKTS
ncbi:MAG: FAD-dependent oxidoreductase [Verrucomicrobiota bacterium]|nr:FAD-dependent oxidoreductase [Verrucomicrobiota bacterium]